MRKLIACAVLAAGLAGCETPGPQAPNIAPNRATKQIVTFVCQDSTTFTAAFLVSPDVVDLHFPSGDTVRLQRERSGSGFLYRNPFYSLQGKGGEAIYSFGRRAPTTCRAK